MKGNTMAELKFYHPDYDIGCGGTETPFPYEGKMYLYVWNRVELKHEYYCFTTDEFIPDNRAPWMEGVTV